MSFDYSFSGVTMTFQINQKEKYLYDNFFSSLKGATVTPVPGISYYPVFENRSAAKNTYCAQQTRAEFFIDTVQTQTGSSSIDDIFEQKLTLNKDRTRLILNDIIETDTIHKNNLKSLYDDLFAIEKWRSSRPHPENYLKDKTWMDLNKMEIMLHDQIRRELKDASKATAFNARDLRESLLDFKKQHQKSQMMDGLIDEEHYDSTPENHHLYNIPGDNYST
jgi:hypothetical protein